MSEVEQEQGQEHVEGDEVEGTPVPGPDVSPEEDEEAEAEEAESHDADQEQGEAQGKAAGAVGEKELERMFKRVETANATYSRKLGEIMGEEAGVLEACPRCSAPFLGFIFPPLMKPVTAEQKAAVLVSVGDEPPSVSKADRFSRECESCDGWGRVLSGSKLNAQKTLTCISCQGKGWVAVGDERRVPQQAVAGPVVGNGAESPVEQPPDTDPWGRGPSDPDYGRLPQFAGH